MHSQRPEDVTRRRYVPLAALLCFTFVIDGASYGLLAPLLPVFKQDIGLSANAAGVVTGAFSAAMLPASLLVLVTGQRLSSKWLTVGGLAGMAVGAVLTAVVNDVSGLVIARVVQGVSAGLLFAGAMRWLLALVPPTRRGTWFGTSWGAMNAGSVLGPAIGTLALRFGLLPVQGTLAAVTGLTVVVLAFARRSMPAQDAVRLTPRALPPVGRRLLLYTAPAAAIGIINSVTPLRLADLGASHGVIGWTFVASGLLSILVSPAVGRWVDHSGSGLPLTVGLALGTVLTVLGGLAPSVIIIAVCTVAILGLSNEVSVIPAGHIVEETGDLVGLTSAASTLVPIVYAVFETLGAFLSGPLSSVNASLPFLVLAAANLATMVIWLLTGRKPIVVPEPAGQSL